MELSAIVHRHPLVVIPKLRHHIVLVSVVSNHPILLQSFCSPRRSNHLSLPSPTRTPNVPNPRISNHLFPFPFPYHHPFKPNSNISFPSSILLAPLLQKRLPPLQHLLYPLSLLLSIPFLILPNFTKALILSLPPLQQLLLLHELLKRFQKRALSQSRLIPKPPECPVFPKQQQTTARKPMEVAHPGSALLAQSFLQVVIVSTR